MLALRALQRPVDSWDDLLVHILSAKLDSVTLKEWQASLKGTSLPTFKQLVEFIAHHSQVLETSSKDSLASVKRYDTRAQVRVRQQSSYLATFKGKCAYCNGEHAIYSCKEFLSMSITQRAIEARKRKLCINCLRSAGHRAADCQSETCRICHSRHTRCCIARKQGARQDQGVKAEVLQSLVKSQRLLARVNLETRFRFSFLRRLFMLTIAMVRENHVAHCSIAAHKQTSSLAAQ